MGARRTGLAAMAIPLLVAGTSGTPAAAQGFFGGLFGPPPPMQSRSEAGEPLMTPDQRRTMQRVLADRGFYRGAVNGALTGATRRAIADWQADIGERPTGFLTRRQLAELLRAAGSRPAPGAPVASAPAEAPAPVAEPPPAVAAPAARLLSGPTDPADAPEAERQAAVAYALLTAAALNAIGQEAPGQPTPAALVATLAPLWLGEAQIQGLFREILDASATGAEAAPGAGQTRAARAQALLEAVRGLAPDGQARLSSRFDETYRRLILMQARALPLRLTTVAARIPGAYDTAQSGYPLAGAGAESGPDGWPRLVVRIAGAEPAPLLPVSEPRGLPPRIFEARTLAVTGVRLGAGPGEAIEVTATLEERSFFADARLTRPLSGQEPAGAPVAALPQAAPPAPQAAAPPAAGAREPFDILGLRLGMTLAEASRLVDGLMPGNRYVEVTPLDRRATVTFAYGRVHVSRDNREYIALVTQPDRSGQRIVAIGRYLYGGLGAFDRGELIRDFSAKYRGEPLRAGPLLHWGGPSRPSGAETPCHLQLGAIGNADWVDQRGAYPDWRDYVPPGTVSTFKGPASMNWLGLRVPDMNRLADYADCGETVAVWIPDIRGRAGEFSAWLADPKAYLELLAGPPLQGSAVRPRL